MTAGRVDQWITGAPMELDHFLTAGHTMLDAHPSLRARTRASGKRNALAAGEMQLYSSTMSCPKCEPDARSRWWLWPLVSFATLAIVWWFSTAK